MEGTEGVESRLRAGGAGAKRLRKSKRIGRETRGDRYTRAKSAWLHVRTTRRTWRKGRGEGGGVRARGKTRWSHDGKRERETKRKKRKRAMEKREGTARKRAQDDGASGDRRGRKTAATPGAILLEFK